MLLPSCMVYDSDLLNDAVGGDGDGDTGSGGRGSGGRGTGGDDDGPSGGMGADGGDPGDGDGDGDSGGSSSGGRSSGGGDSGGAPSTGGGGTGGASGGNGSGGSPPACSAATAPCVVDDLEHIGSASYSSSPFRGTWSRYIEDPDPPPAVPPAFTASSMSKMVVEESAENDNGTLHVQATGLTQWGVGVFLTVKGGSTQDLSGYTGIRFRAKSMNDETAINVALADDTSHSPVCEDVNDGIDCNHHLRSSDAPTFALDSDWTTLELPLNGFVDSADTPPREEPLDLTKIYAIHFQLDTEGEEADYYIDDIEMY